MIRIMPYSKKWLEANPEIFVQRNRARVMRYRKTDKGKFFNLREVARRRNIENTLTPEEFLKLLEGDCCFWCAGDLPTTRAGLDRVNNEIGYTFENCVRCCWSCNVMKAQMSASDFIAKCESVVGTARKRASHGSS
jgi:hypothetical protein